MNKLRDLMFMCLLVAGNALWAGKLLAATENYITLEDPRSLSSFELEDQYGQEFSAEHLKHQWSMIMIGFTSCPDVCPTTLSNLEAVRAEMGLRMRPDNIPKIVFLAVDPARDRAVLKEYLAYFHPQYVGITGANEQMDRLINSIQAFYRLGKKSADDQDYDVSHTAFVSIINPQGEMVAKLNPPFHPHKTAEYLIHLIRGVKFDDKS